MISPEEERDENESIRKALATPEFIEHMRKSGRYLIRRDIDGLVAIEEYSGSEPEGDVDGNSN